MLLRSHTGGILPAVTCRRAFAAARAAAFTAAEAASPVATRIYDLRHACLSRWLNAGVPATQVAEWAGNSIDVLLNIYAKCITGEETLYKQRIQAADCTQQNCLMWTTILRIWRRHPGYRRT